MTVVVGFCCDEGIVIASDSQISAGATRRWDQKVWVVDNPGFAFGVAGVESTMHLLRDYLLGATFDTSDPRSIQSTITNAAVTVLQPEYARTISLLPPAQATFDNLPQGAALVGIYAAGAPHLFELASNGLVTDHHARSFAAIGVGVPFAEHAVTIFREHQVDMTLHQAKMLAFRVVQDAIAAAGPGIPVGGPVQLATVAAGSPPTCVLLPWDDPELKDAVDGWTAAEAMRFREHVPPGEAE
ncbi:MAG: hypothetical protein Q7R32_06885 [Dehalococcoidia bacterium]|nr:hypothetical protein [Dehalococcoidia bacterium]